MRGTIPPPAARLGHYGEGIENERREADLRVGGEVFLAWEILRHTGDPHELQEAARAAVPTAGFA